MRSAGVLMLGLAMLTAGVLFGLYGVFAILYGGDRGGNGDTYITISGHEFDAGLAGGIALLVSFLALVIGMTILRRPRRESERIS